MHTKAQFALGTILWFLICIVGLSTAEMPDSLPSISELDKLRTTATSNNDGSAYSAVCNMRGLFLAFGAGLDAISRYREPILTRGSQGISVFKAVSPAVVVVVVGKMSGHNFDPEGMGTGAIVDARGYVLTNWHVISGYSGALRFLKPNGSAELASARALGAKVIYSDQTADLALLRMINPPAALPALSVGDVNQIQVAEDIHIIGHPHGNLWSYSTGVVSQVRDGYSWSYVDGSRHLAKVLQLQTSINPGNSGGPVVDDSGKILGLVAMSQEGQNLDYAIAADVIKGFLLVGMQMNTRGLQILSQPSTRPDQSFVAKLPDGSPVLKAVYTGAVIYKIEAIDKKPIGLVAKFTDGSVFRAWDPGPFDSFSSWSATLPDGRQFIGFDTNGVLDLVSMK